MTQGYEEPTYGYGPPPAPKVGPKAWPATMIISMVLFGIYLIPLTLLLLWMIVESWAIASNPADDPPFFGGTFPYSFFGGIAFLLSLLVLPFVLFPTLTFFMLLTRGQWARILHTVAYSIPLAGVAWSVTNAGDRNMTLMTLSLLLLGIAPLVLLWLPASNAFFRTRTAPAPLPPQGYWPPGAIPGAGFASPGAGPTPPATGFGFPGAGFEPPFTGPAPTGFPPPADYPPSTPPYDGGRHG